LAFLDPFGNVPGNVAMSVSQAFLLLGIALYSVSASVPLRTLNDLYGFIRIHFSILWTYRQVI